MLPQEQHRRGLEVHLQGPRGLRRDRLRDGQPPRGLQGLRPRRRVRRPPDLLHQVPGPLQGRPPGQGLLRERRRPLRQAAGGGVRRARHQVPRLWRGPRTGRGVQPDVQDPHRPRVCPRRVPEAGDRPGYLRQLPQPLQVQQGEDAPRRDPDRQELQERDRAPPGYDPHEGVQPDGGRALRGPRGQGLGQVPRDRERDPGPHPQHHRRAGHHDSPTPPASPSP